MSNYSIGLPELNYTWKTKPFSTSCPWSLLEFEDKLSLRRFPVSHVFWSLSQAPISPWSLCTILYRLLQNTLTIPNTPPHGTPTQNESIGIDWCQLMPSVLTFQFFFKYGFTMLYTSLHIKSHSTARSGALGHSKGSYLPKSTGLLSLLRCSKPKS